MTNQDDVRTEAEKYLKEIIEPIARIPAEEVNRSLTDLLANLSAQYQSALDQVKNGLSSASGAALASQQKASRELSDKLTMQVDTINARLMNAENTLNIGLKEQIANLESHVKHHLEQQLAEQAETTVKALQALEIKLDSRHKVIRNLMMLALALESFALYLVGVH